jgi:hypothetical protein
MFAVAMFLRIKLAEVDEIGWQQKRRFQGGGPGMFCTAGRSSRQDQVYHRHGRYLPKWPKA